MNGSADLLGQHIEGRTLLHGPSAAWDEIDVRVLERNASQDEFLVPAIAEPLLVWIASGSAFIEERELTGEWVGQQVEAGDFFLTQSETPYLMRWRSPSGAPFEVVHVVLGLPLLAEAVAEIQAGAASVRIRDVSAQQDPLVSGLLETLGREVRRGQAASTLFVQGIARALAVHLVRRYADVVAGAPRRKARLTAFALRRVMQFLEQRLAEPFDLDGAAAELGMSRFHFSRAFSTTVGLPPTRWFIGRRIEVAKQLLRETDRSVLSIALGVGYASPSRFAHVFGRQAGMAPQEYRRRQREMKMGARGR